MHAESLLITDDDIRLAEKILLPNGESFDDERVAFIRDMRSLDLQAVPGSGKTTALLAKLLILERKLPFDDGSGILVISHTNIAIDEIRNRIGRYCPKLFAYPNFIGTIQSFVDQFLAIPFAQNYMRIRIDRIDTDAYQESLWRRFKRVRWNSECGRPGELFNAKFYSKQLAAANGDKQKAEMMCEKDIEAAVKGLYIDEQDGNIMTSTARKAVLKANTTSAKYNALRELIDSVMRDGLISYEFAYLLGVKHIARCPRITRVIRKRFPIVFVDEMQDMEQKQHDVLEKLFNNQDVIYQRIGDKNQAIFSGPIKLNDIWIDRDIVLPLTGSYRLSPQNAAVVGRFALNDAVNMQGLMNSGIKPCLIVYSKEKIDRVLPTYTRIVKERIPEQVLATERYPIKCVGWVATDNDSKITLKSYFPNFEKETTTTLLPSYLEKSHSVGATPRVNVRTAVLAGVRLSILIFFREVLRLCDIRKSDGSCFNLTAMNRFLREIGGVLYDNFKLRVFRWSIAIHTGKGGDVMDQVRSYLPEFLSMFGAEHADLSEINFDWCLPGSTDPNGDTDKLKNTYTCPDSGLSVKIGTVHSSKGETHLATLYVETSYYAKHESEMLGRCFCGAKHGLSGKEGKDVRMKEAIRVLYVGISRPKYLLCYAIEKSRYHKVATELQGWDIVEVD